MDLVAHVHGRHDLSDHILIHLVAHRRLEHALVKELVDVLSPTKDSGNDIYKFRRVPGEGCLKCRHELPEQPGVFALHVYEEADKGLDVA